MVVRVLLLHALPTVYFEYSRSRIARRLAESPCLPFTELVFVVAGDKKKQR